MGVVVIMLMGCPSYLSEEGFLGVRVGSVGLKNK